jgi:UDP-N-acetylmuramyl pentapeptide phosphotransferase/UDP-N-acetylglucosamine-1-phosphate transferase
MTIGMMLLLVTTGFCAAIFSWLLIRQQDPWERYRKAEPEPISRLGGLAMVAASTVGLILLAALRPKLEWAQWAPALITIGLLFALGFWDDLHPLGAKAKLTGQFLIAGSAYGMGLRV